MVPVPFTGQTGGSTPTNIAIRLAGFAHAETSVAGVDTDVYSFTIPANTLVNEGDALHIRAGGRSLTTVESKTGRILIGSVEINVQAMNTLANGYFFENYVTKKTADNAAYNYGRNTRDISLVASVNHNEIAVDWTVDNTFLFRMTSVTSGTIEMRWLHVDLFKVPT
jgi:hypothetical protein